MSVTGLRKELGSREIASEGIQQLLLTLGGLGVSGASFPAAIYLEITGWLLLKLHSGGTSPKA